MADITGYKPNEYGGSGKILHTFVDNGDGTFSEKVAATLSTGDIEIGAVEIKNATDDTRAVVKTDGTNNALVVVQNVAPPPSVGATAGVSLVTSSALEASHVLKASAGTLVSLVGYNSGAAQFIQVHNSATAPADAAVPKYVFTVPASSNFSLDFPITGAPFTTGISVCNSSTAASKTVGAADCFFSAVVK